MSAAQPERTKTAYRRGRAALQHSRYSRNNPRRGQPRAKDVREAAHRFLQRAKRNVVGMVARAGVVTDRRTGRLHRVIEELLCLAHRVQLVQVPELSGKFLSSHALIPSSVR